MEVTSRINVAETNLARFDLNLAYVTTLGTCVLDYTYRGKIFSALAQELLNGEASVATEALNHNRFHDFRFRKVRHRTLELTGHGVTEQLRRTDDDARVTVRGSGPTICWAPSNRIPISTVIGAFLLKFAFLGFKHVL
jgi:hypothetical protein